MFQTHHHRKKSERHGGHSNEFPGKRCHLSQFEITEKVIEQAAKDTTQTEESLHNHKAPTPHTFIQGQVDYKLSDICHRNGIQRTVTLTDGQTRANLYARERSSSLIGNPRINPQQAKPAALICQSPKIMENKAIAGRNAGKSKEMPRSLMTSTENQIWRHRQISGTRKSF